MAEKWPVTASPMFGWQSAAIKGGSHGPARPQANCLRFKGLRERTKVMFQSKGINSAQTVAEQHSCDRSGGLTRGTEGGSSVANLNAGCCICPRVTAANPVPEPIWRRSCSTFNRRDVASSAIMLARVFEHHRYGSLRTEEFVAEFPHRLQARVSDGGEFRCFLDALILLPCQIVPTSRQIVSGFFLGARGKRSSFDSSM